MTGRIEYYNKVKGYGFVVDDEEPRTSRFFHVSNVRGDEPIAGRAVTYEEGDTKRGPVALDVIVKKGGEAGGQ